MDLLPCARFLFRFCIVLLNKTDTNSALRKKIPREVTRTSKTKIKIVFTFPCLVEIHINKSKCYSEKKKNK